MMAGVERGPFLMRDWRFAIRASEDTRRTAGAIPGAQLTVMKGLGHFPMSEDPAPFRAYLRPVLEQIRAHAARP